MRPARSSILLVLLGALLLANGAYVYPEGVSYEQYYRAEAEPIQSGVHPTGQFGTVTIHQCAGELDSEECAVVRYHASVGEIHLDTPGEVYGEVTDESEQLPEFFHLDDGYYQRTAAMDGDDLVVSVETVPDEQVFRTTAENVSEVPDPYRAAVRNGTARTEEKLIRSRLLVHDGGQFYRVHASGPYRGNVTGWGWKEPGQDVINLLRITGWTAGIALLWFAGYRYANRS